MKAGAGQPQRRAGGGDQAAGLAPSPPRRPSRLVVARSGGPATPQLFFWISMIASARSSRCFRRRLSRRESASSPPAGLVRRFWGRAWRGSALRRRLRRADAASPTALTSKAPRGARSRRPLRGTPAARSASQGCALLLRRECAATGTGPKVQATQQPALKRSSASGFLNFSAGCCKGLPVFDSGHNHWMFVLCPWYGDFSVKRKRFMPPPFSSSRFWRPVDRPMHGARRFPDDRGVACPRRSLQRALNVAPQPCIRWIPWESEPMMRSCASGEAPGRCTHSQVGIRPWA